MRKIFRPISNSALKILLISALILSGPFSRAQVKEHVKTIERGTKTSDFPKNNSSQNKDIFSVLFGSMIEPITKFLLMPFFPILYATLDFHNPSDEQVQNEKWGGGISAGNTNTFKTLSINSFYKYKGVTLKIDSARFTEGYFISDFSTLSASYTPNWNKIFKTGIGAGFRLINYKDHDLNNSGLINGFILELPTTLSLEGNVTLYYSPRYVFYERGVNSFEIDAGLQYDINPRWNLKMGIERREILDLDKKDFTYFYLGTGISF